MEQISTGSPSKNIFLGHVTSSVPSLQLIDCLKLLLWVWLQVGKATALGNFFLVGKIFLLQDSLEFWLVTT